MKSLLIINVILFFSSANGQSQLGSPSYVNDCPANYGIALKYRTGRVYHPAECVRNDQNCVTYDNLEHKCDLCQTFYILADSHPRKPVQCILSIEQILPIGLIGFVIVALVIWLIWDCFYIKKDNKKEKEQTEHELEGKPFENIDDIDYTVSIDAETVRLPMFGYDQDGNELGPIDAHSLCVSNINFDPNFLNSGWKNRINQKVTFKSEYLNIDDEDKSDIAINDSDKNKGKGSNKNLTKQKSVSDITQGLQTDNKLLVIDDHSDQFKKYTPAMVITEARSDFENISHIGSKISNSNATDLDVNKTKLSEKSNSKDNIWNDTKNEEQVQLHTKAQFKLGNASQKPQGDD